MTTTTLEPVSSSNQTTTAAQSYWAKAGTRFLRQRVSVVAALILLLLTLAALFAPVVARFDPVEQFRGEGRGADGLPLPPTAKFWLGTDQIQRDVYSRMVYGARSTLTVGLMASLLAVAFGLLYGSIAGLAGNTTDNLLMRLVDMIMSMPTLFIIMLIVVLFETRNLWITILAISVVSWTGPARVFRAEVVSLKERDYVAAARGLGASKVEIFFWHILPQLLPLLVIYTGLGVPGAVFTEAGLSFLGLGVPPPTPVWGGMMSESISFFRSRPVLVMAPGFAIMLTIICFNLLGNGLRDALDPTV